MAIIEGRTWLEQLSRKQCYDLLHGRDIGRIAFLIDGLPEIFPVTYAIDGTDIVFRTDPGTKLDHLREGAHVAFEVDAFDAASRHGESVVVKGRSFQVCDPPHLRRLEQLGLEPWAYGEKANWIAVRPQIVTGRRIRNA